MKPPTMLQLSGGSSRVNFGSVKVNVGATEMLHPAKTNSSQPSQNQSDTLPNKTFKRDLG